MITIDDEKIYGISGRTIVLLGEALSLLSGNSAIAGMCCQQLQQELVAQQEQEETEPEDTTDGRRDGDNSGS